MEFLHPSRDVALTCLNLLTVIMSNSHLSHSEKHRKGAVAAGKAERKSARQARCPAELGSENTRGDRRIM